MNIRILSFLFVLGIFFSCEEESVENEFVVIRAGTICGWCNKNDTLEIKGNLVRYVNYTQCQNANPSVEKTGNILDSEIDHLLANLNVEQLRKLEINTCNFCADGCDDWIYFENDKVSHYIRFSRDDESLKSIKPFIDELFLIKSSYSENN